MDKYQCGPCGYIYDLRWGIQMAVSLQAHLSRIFLMIGYAQFAASPRICSKKYKKA